jgi:hypothetical protein
MNHGKILAKLKSVAPPRFSRIPTTTASTRQIGMISVARVSLTMVA